MGLHSMPPTSAPGRRYVTRAYGDISNLRLENDMVPIPKPDEVRISVRAVGMNFADCFALLGMYEVAGEPPFTPGFEVSGVIDAVGTDVSEFAVGDRVWAIKRFGSYASVVNIDFRYVRLLKEGWTFAEGAAFPAQAFTAWYALCVLGGLPATPVGETRQLTSSRRAVLVHSAAGGVGTQLVAMVRHIGGIAVCTVGQEDKAQMLGEKYGVPRERIIVRGVDDVRHGFEKVVRERALGGAGGVDVVVDSVMGSYFTPGYDLLNAGGRYIVMGTACLMPKGNVNLFRLSGWQNLIRLGWKFLWRPRLDLVASINQNKTVSGFNVGSLFGEVDLVNRGFDEIEHMDLPKPHIGKLFPFEKAVEALKYFQSGKSMGKIVLTLEDIPTQ